MISKFRGAYSFLSNMWLSPITVNGAAYPSVENAFQSAKTSTNKVYFQLCSPIDAKKFGRKVELRKDWDVIKIHMMRKALREKFKAGTDLANRLLSTGEHELVEGNTWGDTYWGVCNGVGENHLGELLMKIRAELNE